MNKVFLGLLLAVCVLGMALIMLNERLGRKNEPGTLTTLEGSVTEHRGAVLPGPDSVRALPETPGAAPQAISTRPAQTGQEYPSTPEPRLEAPYEPEGARPPSPRQDGDAPTPLPASSEKAAPQAAPVPPKVPARTASSGGPVAETPKKAQAKPAAAQPEITKTVVFARDSGATVRFAGNGPIRYKSMTLENPNRVVLDLDGQWQIKAPGVPKNAMVGNVRIGKLPDKTRIVIDLKEKPRQTRVILSKDRDSLDVRIDK